MMAGGKTLGEWAALGLARARAWPRETWLALAVLPLALLLRLNHLDVPTDNYDEGVYTASLRSLAAGHPLFAQTYSAQPPLFLPLLLPWYHLFGETLLAARLGVVLYSLMGLGALWWLATLLGGQRVGFVALTLLAVDPLYLQQSRAVQAEAPALAFAILAVALAASARRRAQPWRAALAGAAFAVALLIKLFVVMALLPIAAFLLAPDFREIADAALTTRHWPERARWESALRACWPTVAASVGAALVVTLLVTLTQADRGAEWAQVIGLHLRATGGGYGSRADNPGVFAGIWWEWPLLLAGFAAGYAAWRARRWSVAVLALWGMANLAVLAVQQPLFAHHLVLLAPACIAAAAFFADPFFTRYAQNVLPLRALQSLRVSSLSVPFHEGIIAALLLIAVVVSGAHTIAAPRVLPLSLAQAVGDLQQFTLASEWVVTDEQMAAVVAGRQVPPALVDTSLVRITSGALTTAQAIAAASDPHVTAILWYSGRFDRLPGFHAWVVAHFSQVITYGGTRGLFLRATPGVPVG